MDAPQMKTEPKEITKRVRPMHLTGMGYTGIIFGLSALPLVYALPFYLHPDIMMSFFHEDIVTFQMFLFSVIGAKIIICLGLLFAKHWAWFLAVVSNLLCIILSVLNALHSPETVPRYLAAFLSAPLLLYLLLRKDTRAYVGL
jgi:uncharacterized membrane protein (DUF2068 family)